MKYRINMNMIVFNCMGIFPTDDEHTNWTFSFCFNRKSGGHRVSLVHMLQRAGVTHDAVHLWDSCVMRPVFTAVKCKEASCLGKVFEEGREFSYTQRCAAAAARKVHTTQRKPAVVVAQLQLAGRHESD